MFSIVNTDVNSFNSSWKKDFSTKESMIQTETYKIVHRGINIKKYRTSESQTDSYLYVEEDIQAEIDETELNDFIKKVTPKIFEALINNENSCAFKTFKSHSSNEDQSICEYIIGNVKDPLSAVSISQLSWNYNGTVLAAAFGDITHNKWCTHINTGVGIYSLSSRNKKQFIEKPDVFLETTTCACCVQFHHSLASLIVAGTHNGEIIVWDRSRSENDYLLANNSENKVHEEPINSVLWLNDSSSKKFSTNFRLISTGFDGTIVLWNLSMRKSSLVPLNCYYLTARDLPKSIRYRGSLSKSLCILCSTLNPFDNEYVVVGMDIGVIFLCLVKNKNHSSTVSEIKEIKSPVESVLATLSGAVHGVQWSKSISYFVAAVAANGTIHIFNVEQKQQLLAIDPGQEYIYDLSLSSLMLGIIATVGENGSIVVTDILEHDMSADGLDFSSDIISNKYTYTTLKCPNKNDESQGKTLNCVEFNNANANYLAASDVDGTIYIWRISPQMIETHSKLHFKNAESILNSVKSNQ